MRVREQQPAARRDEQWEHAGPGLGREAARSHEPLEYPQRGGEQREHAVLEHLGVGEARHEGLGLAERPAPGIAAEEEEHR